MTPENKVQKVKCEDSSMLSHHTPTPDNKTLDIPIQQRGIPYDPSNRIQKYQIKVNTP